MGSCHGSVTCYTWLFCVTLIAYMTDHCKLHKFDADFVNQVRVKYIKMANGVLSAFKRYLVLSFHISCSVSMLILSITTANLV